MAILVLSLIIVVFTLASYIVYLHIKIHNIRLSLKEIIKENDCEQISPATTSTDIYFKIDKEFTITFINESSASQLGTTPTSLIGKSLLGSLLERNDANKEAVKSSLKRITQNQATINTKFLIKNSKNNKKLMSCRQRPILNEILECEGISFLCKDISEVKTWEDNLLTSQNRDTFTNGLNEQAILSRFEHDFKRSNRYNRDFSCIIVELKDIYEFISKGVDFETADRLLKTISDLCFKNLTPNAHIGRIDKTKILMILNDASSELASKIAKKITDESSDIIKNLGIDKDNAQMIVINHTTRNDCNDSFDGMLTRIKRQIRKAIKNREYGIISSDIKINVRKN